MTSQSIYTEYANLSPDHIEWLDGCGATWESGEIFSKYKMRYMQVVFNGRVFHRQSLGSDWQKIPTGSEFCERVAEILGIEKPVFGDKFIKAFEPNEEEINKGIDKAEKEWEVKEKPPLGLTPKYIHDRMREQEIQEAIDRYKLANKEVPEEWLREHFDLISKEGALAHPHRTYRVLDSLDGVPFDKRIPLSEWIPPFEVEVLFIIGKNFFKGNLNQITKDEITLRELGEGEWEIVKTLDGHWMRIV